MTQSREPILKARGLIKRFGKVTALNSCNFDLYPGEVLAVIGDNGAGKSVMIKSLSGAIKPDGGTITLEGREVNFASPLDARKQGIETVYQTLALSPALSIADNMFMGRERRKPGLMGTLFKQLDRPAMSAFAREKLTGRPSSSMLPSSMLIAPEMALIRLDLPAPLSPITARISPG